MFKPRDSGTVSAIYDSHVRVVSTRSESAWACFVRDDRDEGELDGAVGGGLKRRQVVAHAFLGPPVGLLLQPIGDVLGERHVLLWDSGAVVAQSEPGLETAGRLCVTGASVVRSQNHVRRHPHGGLGVNEVGPGLVEAELGITDPPVFRRITAEDRAQFDEAVTAGDGVPGQVAVLRDEDPLVVLDGVRLGLDADDAHVGQWKAKPQATALLQTGSAQSFRMALGI